MRRIARASHLVVVLAGFLCAIADLAEAQGILVSPVNVDMAPGQTAAVLTITNRNGRAVSFQVRGFAWRQGPEGEDELTPTDALLVSPPLGTISPGAAQLVRLVLRRSPQGREAAYRILLDELPPPAEAGVVRLALRLSIPVYSEPAGIVAPSLRWQIVTGQGHSWLEARNLGTRHETVRDVVLQTAEGSILPATSATRPNVLAGGVHRWRISGRRIPAPGAVVALTASAGGGTIHQKIPVDAAP